MECKLTNDSDSWENFEYFEPHWEERTERMAKYILPNQSVVDVGCGEMKLVRYLPAHCSYVGLDSQKRNEETVVCNFNNESIPEISSDVYFISGALEYAIDPESLIRQISQNTKETIILSYCLLEDFPHQTRKDLKWANALSKNDIIKVLKKNGFRVRHSFKVLRNTVFIADRKSFLDSILFFLTTYAFGKNVNSSLPKTISECNVETNMRTDNQPLEPHIILLIEKINSRWSYLGTDALYDLAETVRSIEESDMKGDIIETGCALGGSAIVIATAKSVNRLFRIFDSFGLIPAPSSEDGVHAHERYEIIASGESEGLRGEKYYGYEEDLLQKVKDNFYSAGIDVSVNNIELIKGLFDKTLHITSPVALAHIDCDWYDSVKFCLDTIVPHIVVGGILIIDDYHYYEGCKKAVDEFFVGKQDSYEFINRSRLHIKRIK